MLKRRNSVGSGKNSNDSYFSRRSASNSVINGSKWGVHHSDDVSSKMMKSTPSKDLSIPDNSTEMSNGNEQNEYSTRATEPESLRVVATPTPANAQPDPFPSHELKEYSLPPWNILSEVVDFYFIYVNPNLLLLPCKNFFLKRLALNSDSSILHAMITVVCTRRKWQFEEGESYWLDQMHRFWDNLNDFGMLLCYSLVAQAPIIKNKFHNFVGLNDSMFEVIKSNRYLDVLQASSNLNTRKRFENEALIRMIWIYWIGSLIFRLRLGRPYSKLFMMRNDNVLVNSDLSHQHERNFPLPVPNESYVKCQDSRRAAWDDLNNGICEDSATPIKAALILQQVMDKISNNELSKDNLVLASEFRNMLKDRLYLVKEDTLIVNAHFIVSNFLINYADIIQRCHFINHLLAFEVLMRSSMRDNKSDSGIDDTRDYIPRLNTFAANNIINLEELPSSILEMDSFQWACLIAVIEDTLTIIELINVHLGILPSDTTPRYSVLYGVTCLDASRDWFMSKELISRGESTWLKASDFSVIAACSLVSIIPSLIVLRKLFEIRSNGEGKSQAVLSKSGEVLDFDVEVPVKALNGFNHETLQKGFDRVLEFIRFRTQYDAKRSLQEDTITNINKVGHYLEEILQSMR